MDSDFRFHVRENAFDPVRRVDFLPFGFRQETVAYEEFAQVADEGTVRLPQPRVGEPFPARPPVGDFHFQIVPENLGKAFEEPPERGFVRFRHFVRDPFEDPVRFPPREFEEVTVGGGDLVGLARLDGDVPGRAYRILRPAPAVDHGERGFRVPGVPHRGSEPPVIGGRLLAYGKGRERIAGNPVDNAEEAPLPRSLLSEERRVEDRNGVPVRGNPEVHEDFPAPFLAENASANLRWTVLSEIPVSSESSGTVCLRTE